MAVQWALVAENGEVQHVVSAGADADYEEGSSYHGLMAVSVGTDADAQEYMETKIYVNSAWQVRAARPDEWYDWNGGSWVFQADRFWAHIRQERDIRLYRSDWTQLSDVYFNVATKSAWASYRSALRDVPVHNADATSVSDIVWPVQPT